MARSKILINGLIIYKNHIDIVDLDNKLQVQSFSMNDSIYEKLIKKNQKNYLIKKSLGKFLKKYPKFLRFF